MKNFTFILLLLLIQFNSYAQYEKPTISAPSDLMGNVTKEDFKQEPFNQWFDENYDNYRLNESVVKEIKNHINGISIKAFLGTWCGDSQIEVPQFYKLLDALNFDYKNLKMIAVDRDNKTPDNLQEGLNIIRVPTFIFYKNDVEIGRYVEFPRESLEKDILKIVSGKTYKHSYETD